MKDDFYDSGISNKKLSQLFFILALVSLLFLVSIRVTQNDWYENIEGQCGINDNGTCDGWQFGALLFSFIFIMIFSILGLISRSYYHGKVTE